jgi:eukaryotic-like serine/threonine-protein kinase
MSLPAGTRLGPYEIVSFVAAGGMGEVYRARDMRLKRSVAVKILPASFASDPERLRRFEQEARAVAALNHPNILAIHDIGTHDGTSYLVSEFLEGNTLRAQLAGEALPTRKAIEYALQIAQGLGAAHDKGIVHRDLKPENIFITNDGRLKILDFGLAKVQTPAATHYGTTDVAQTTPGAVMGTAGYMSPEQVRGEDLDHRSDIFTFGAVLYEMLSGSRAFKGRTSAEIMSAVLRDDPPDLTGVTPPVHPTVLRTIRHCLEKNPLQRFQSAHDLAFQLGMAIEGPDLQRLKHDTDLRNQVLPAARLTVQNRLFMAVMLVVLIVALGLVGYHFIHRPPNKISVAVLPLVNAAPIDSGTPNAEMDYLADGITDGIIDRLSRISRLRVVARDSVFHYRQTQENPVQIGLQLHVSTVVVGRVFTRGDTVSVETAMVNVSNSSEIWRKQYRRKLSETATVHDDIASAIARQLGLKLTSEEERQLAKHDTENPEAYQLYLKGLFYWNKWTKDGFRKATDYFNQAVKKDPHYAKAYAGLADTYNFLGESAYTAPEQVWQKAKSAAMQAVKLDDTLPEAHISLALVREGYDWDWAGAESEFKRAIQLNPNYASSHQWYGDFLTRMGRFDEARMELKKAQELDPLSLLTNTSLGRLHYFTRQYDAAVQQFKKTLDMDPKFGPAQHAIEQAYFQTAMYGEAIGERQKVLTLSGNPDLAAVIGEDYIKSGYLGVMRSWMEGLQEISKKEYVSHYNMARLHIVLEDKEQAITGLEQAFKERDSNLTYMKVEPAFDEIRSDPRFQQLLHQLGWAE